MSNKIVVKTDRDEKIAELEKKIEDLEKRIKALEVYCTPYQITTTGVMGDYGSSVTVSGLMDITNWTVQSLPNITLAPAAPLTDSDIEKAIEEFFEDPEDK